MSEPGEPFEAFYGEHYQSVFRALSLAFRSRLLAEDAAQEAFTRAYVRWARVSRMERPAGWVFVTATRIALRGRRSPERQMFEAREAPRAVDDEAVDKVTLQRAIGTLPERQRLALLLRHYADLPLEEIATAMGCALGTVKSTLHAAHTRLQVELDDDDIPEVELDAP